MTRSSFRVLLSESFKLAELRIHVEEFSSSVTIFSSSFTISIFRVIMLQGPKLFKQFKQVEVETVL